MDTSPPAQRPRSSPGLFTIPPGLPFLDTLVDALLEGRLIDGFRSDPGTDPFALADVTLLLPTRRAARAVRESFLARSPGALLLPRIRTLGDLDEDEADDAPGGAADLPPAVPAAERQLALTTLVLGWSAAQARALAGFPDEPLVVPASPADAARLAAALEALIDQVGVEPQAWLGLASDHGDLTRYWEITRGFLAIATAAWPAHLEERGLLDPGARRDALIRAEAERLRREGSVGPVIAAGSTGSVPATAELLAAIAALPNGAVVLPGLDQDLDAASWEAIGADPDDPAGFGHPQFGLKRLIERLGIVRTDVVALGVADGVAAMRARVLSEAMRPADTTERWTSAPVLDADGKAQALAGVAIVEAAHEREEALAIATLFRRTVHEGRIAALVTPDRGLARRVAVELRRWGIDADDSAGRPLPLTPPGTLARLVADAALGGAEADTLLALARHPLAAFGLAPGQARRAARALERAVLRGPRLAPGLAALRHALAQRAADHALPLEMRPRPTAAAHGLRAHHWTDALDLGERMHRALEPLERLAGSGPLPFATLAAAHRAALEAVAATASGTRALHDGEDGAALEAALDALGEGAAMGPDIPPADYPGLFAALIERTMVRRPGSDPRVQIWGALEARLQRVDVTVLGGFNEGTWPAAARADPLASRPMRVALALDPPERRIGLAAHDAAQALAQGEVWVTRAQRENGEPRVASRWLQRLAAYAGPALADDMRARGAEMLRLARTLDLPRRDDPPMRPRPSPPRAARPKGLSATRIETLIRDPYAVYADRILRLKPFEPLATLPDARDRGTLVHDILENFIRARPAGPYDDAAHDALLAMGREAFAHFSDVPEMIALWWPRFERIARWFITAEAALGDVTTRHVENSGALAVTPDFTLTARADRLDVLADGTLAIIDYKTGAPPSMKEVRTLSPQLPLEALIAEAGGFPDLPATPAGRLLYYRLTGRGEGGESADRTSAKDAPLSDTLEATRRRLAELVAYFEREDAVYLSNKVPQPRRGFAGDYDHLARISEWVATDEEDEG